MWEGNSIWNFPFLPRDFWKPMDTWLYPLSLLDSNQQMEVLHPVVPLLWIRKCVWHDKNENITGRCNFKI